MNATQSMYCICSAQSRNRYNSRIVLRKVGIGTKWEYLLLYEVGIETKLEYRIYCNLFQVIVFDVLPTYAV